VLSYELGDVTFWVEIDKRKPFPIVIYRKDGDWTYDAITQSLTTQEQTLVQGFFRERTQDLDRVWGKHTKVNLNWQKRRRTK
jgi:hypothetical protein